MRGAWVDILEASILRFTHGPEYTLHPLGLNEHRRDLVRKEEQMDNPASYADILKWIEKKIAIEGTEASW